MTANTTKAPWSSDGMFYDGEPPRYPFVWLRPGASFEVAPGPTAISFYNALILWVPSPKSRAYASRDSVELRSGREVSGLRRLSNLGRPETDSLGTFRPNEVSNYSSEFLKFDDGLTPPTSREPLLVGKAFVSACCFSPARFRSNPAHPEAKPKNGRFNCRKH